MGMKQMPVSKDAASPRSQQGSQALQRVQEGAEVDEDEEEVEEIGDKLSPLPSITSSQNGSQVVTSSRLIT